MGSHWGDRALSLAWHHRLLRRRGGLARPRPRTLQLVRLWRCDPTPAVETARAPHSLPSLPQQGAAQLGPLLSSLPLPFSRPLSPSMGGRPNAAASRCLGPGPAGPHPQRRSRKYPSQNRGRPAHSSLRSRRYPSQNRVELRSVQNNPGVTFVTPPAGCIVILSRRVRRQLWGLIGALPDVCCEAHVRSRSLHSDGAAFVVRTR